MKKTGSCVHLRIRWLLKMLLTMRLLAFFLLLSVVPVSASVFGQYAKVSLRVENVSLEKVMDILERSTDYRFVYQNSQVESVRDLTLNFKDTDIRDVMKECLKGSGLTFNVVGMNVVIVPLGEKQPVQQDVKKEKQVKGRVTDKGGLPVPGVSVLIDSTTIGVVTDIDGNYVLTYPEMKNVRLRFSFIGMQTKYVVVGNKTVINVILEEEINRLDEEVKLHDPWIALDGKEDGLYFYRLIVKDSIRYLNKGGYILFEIGFDQGKDVSELLKNEGYEEIEIKKDLAGLDRVVMGRYNKE